jgi:predicted TIM-barrel fold metal-dependent hydrolase
MRRRPDPDESAKTPFPMSPVSNGEWMPSGPTKKQRIAEKVVVEEADRIAKRHAMTRAQFLRTAAGTMLGFSVLNRIHGLDAWGDNAVLPVRREDVEDLDAACERLSTKPYFIMDVQTHHVDLNEFNSNVFCFLRFRNDPGDPACSQDVSVIGQTNYIREMFLDSETHVSVISGLPSGVPCGPEAMSETAALVNQLAGSERCLSQAMIDPSPAPTIPNPNRRTGLDTLAHQVEELGGRAIKCYSYNGNWRLDDETIAYPMYEQAVALGIGLVNCHKGLPATFAPGSEESVRTTDIPKAVADWPKLKFCAYHSGYFEGAAHPEGKDGIAEFVEVVESMPKKHRKRVYAEIGSTFAITVLSDLGDPGPMRAAHFIGQLLKTLGSKNILWGTDSIWWGSPQWLIDAFKILQIPASLQEQFGYPALKEKDRRRIFGENAARLYKVKKKQRKALCPVPADALTDLQTARGGARVNRSLAYYGARTRREFLQRFGSTIG